MIKRIVYAILFIQSIFWTAELTRRSHVSDSDFAQAVLSHYIRYYCPRAGICTTTAALENMRTASPNWEKIYNRGFSVLENENL